LLQDPVSNVLPLGDLYQPLFQASDVYCAFENRRVVGVCSVYHAYSTPSIVFSAVTRETKQALVERAINRVSGEFVSLCNLNEVELLKEHAAILHYRLEQQMVVNPPKHIDDGKAEVTRVKRDELELLSTFYAEHHAEAWTPLQFKVGPYYCIKQYGRIVSAAGVHIVTPRIAQLGNIATDEAYRNRGFATACTDALATSLASKGRIISLFVRTGNTPAIHMYEKLGFVKKREIAFVGMRKHA
jgi:predicted GNAT family acetyltransferase